MKFTDIFIKRPVLSMSISFLILLIGFQALMGMQIRQYPKMTNTVLTISTPYYGASSELIQGFVTQPLQQAVAEVENVAFVQSSSSQGMSTITAQMKLDADPDAALAAVLAKVNSVRGTLPNEIQDPIISNSNGRAISIVYLSFFSEELNASQITDYLNRVIQPQLVTIEGVAKAQLIGASPFAVRIWLDPDRMTALKLSASEVLNALRANNIQSAPGQIKSDWFDYSVQADTSLTDVASFEELVVATKDNQFIRLKDIAEVELDAGRSVISATADGKKAVLIGIDGTPKANPLDIAKNIREVIPKLRKTMPDSIKMELLYDSTLVIEESINEVIMTIIEAILIVVVVIFLFMGSFRAVLMPIVTIPLSLIGVAMMMQFMGFSINLMTLLAMVLAIGLVVDDAIVVVENVDRMLKKGETPFRAAILGTREIALPVITMTITLAAVYAPIAFLGGLTGTLFREFALTLAGAVFISGVIALTLSPMMSSKLLKPKNKEKGFEAKVHSVLERVENTYGRMLNAILTKRPVFIVFALIVFTSLPFLFNMSTAELAPEEDQGVVMVMATAPDNSHLDYLEQHMAVISDIVKKEPEAVAALTIAGIPSSNQGMAIAPLNPWSERTISVKQMTGKLTPPIQALPGVQATPFSMPALPGASSGLPVQFVITSPGDYKTLYKVAQEIQVKAQASGHFIFSQLDMSYQASNVNVTINRQKAGALGVTMQEISNTLSVLLGDGYVNRISIDGRGYEVIPQVVREDRLTPESIGGFYVYSLSGKPVPLSSLIDFKVESQPRALNQFNQINAVILAGVLMPNTSIGSAVDFLTAEAAASFPADFSYDFLGESRQYVEEGSALYQTFILALIIIYLLLAAQFESLRDPFVILVSVPLAACGALIVLGLGISTLNIYSQVGLITLIGLITKHGILICEVAKEEQIHNGLSRFEAIRHAAKVRLRPILMTTAAMVAGLIPLITAQGAGAASRFSMGIVIVAGLLVGTLFTLFVLPVVYTYIASSHKPIPIFDESVKKELGE